MAISMLAAGVIFRGLFQENPNLGAVNAAIVGVQTKGASAEARGVGARGIRAFLARRDAAAIMLTVVLWALGMAARPDFWGSLDNSFNLLLAFTEIALVSIGLTFVIANGDVETPEDAAEIIRRSGADAVMVGRGAQGRSRS